MQIPVERMAAAVLDIARWEKSRLKLASDAVRRGNVEPAPDVAFQGQALRLLELEAAAALLTILAPHEARVRALDPALERPEPTMSGFFDRERR